MLLEARNLEKRYGGIHAVDGISLTVPDSSILGVIGANGSGKTTCLNMLTRLTPPSGGEILLDGTSYLGVAPHRLTRMGISRTFQNLRLFNDLTVRENVALGAQYSRHKRGERRLRALVDDLLEQTGLAPCRDALPSLLPYGTQRKVEIARALASDPEILFLDEPFAGMSPEEAVEVCALLAGRREASGMSIVIVDHNIEVLSGFARHMLALAEGRIISAGAPADVLTDPAVVSSYVGSDV